MGATRPASERYSKIVPWKQEPYKVIGINDNTLQLLQYVLENTISTHQASLSPISRCHCDEDQTDKNEQPSKEEPRSDRETDKYQSEYDNTYVVDWTERHIGLDPHLRYVAHWYR